MNEETTQRDDETRSNAARATDAAETESSGLEAERESAAAMDTDVPPPPDESEATEEQKAEGGKQKAESSGQ